MSQPNLNTINSNKLLLSLVVPVFNEADSIAVFLQKIQQVFSTNNQITIEMIFVDDGSTDNTLQLLLTSQELDSRIKIIELSRNFGKEAALAAGLQVSTGQVVVPIDVDLQDPPELILAMLEQWHAGFDVVLGHRLNRAADQWHKRITAACFYKIYNLLTTNKIPANVGDFRLMDRRVVTTINQIVDPQCFMKGSFAWVGFRTTTIDYVRIPRTAGSTKFNYWRLWQLALTGITNFSIRPLQLPGYLAIATILILINSIFVVFSGITIFLLIASFILLSLSVIGIYIGKIYLASIKRPAFIIRQIYAATIITNNTNSNSNN